MKLAFADVYRYVADPRTMEVTPAADARRAYLAERAQPDRHETRGAPELRPARGAGGTIYLSAADESGMMVLFIQSQLHGLRLRGGRARAPASACRTAATASRSTRRTRTSSRGGKRPFHTIIPAFLTQDGAPVMSFGVMGGNMQPQGHVQTLVRMLDYGQQPQAACDAPRWKVNRDFRSTSKGHAARDGRGARGAGPRVEADRRQLPGLRLRPVHLAPADDPRAGYVAASDAAATDKRPVFASYGIRLISSAWSGLGHQWKFVPRLS